ncbi:MAG: alpha/beta hydrolase fold domain-containing protein [Planctomycetota bacterium]
MNRPLCACPAVLRAGAAVLLALPALVGARPEDPPRPGPQDGAAPDEVRRRFERLDRNGDGRITPDELPRPALFRALDRDGDGAITLDEARSLQGPDQPEGDRRQPKLPPEVPLQVERDVAYFHADGAPQRLLSLDVYAPTSPGPHPVLVFVHGGAWRTGDKRNAACWEAKSRCFVARGYVFVGVNYRLSPAVKHPTHVEDLARALRWVRAEIGKRGGDPAQVFLMGHSAGAHLVALVATDERRLAAVGESLASLRGVVVLDTAALDPENAQDEQRFYEVAFGERATWADAAPLRFVAKDKHIPPFLVLHTPRKTSSVASRRFVEALRAAQVPAAAVLAPDRDHGGLNRCIGEPDDPYTALVLRFLERPTEANGLRLKDAPAPR